MILVIGGAYQGKLRYVKNEYGVEDAEIFDGSTILSESGEALLNAAEIEAGLQKRVVYQYEVYVEWCLKNGREPKADFSEEQIVISDELFSGVVPMEKELRLLRETLGKTLTKTAISAEKVVRVFCGIPKTIKG